MDSLFATIRRLPKTIDELRSGISFLVRRLVSIHHKTRHSRTMITQNSVAILELQERVKILEKFQGQVVSRPCAFCNDCGTDTCVTTCQGCSPDDCDDCFLKEVCG